MDISYSCTQQGVGQLAAASPRVVLIPLLILLLLLGAGELGVWVGSYNFSQRRHIMARGLVASKAHEINSMIHSWLAPVIAGAAVVRRTPHIAGISRDVQSIAQPILEKVSARCLSPKSFNLAFQASFGTLSWVRDRGPGAWRGCCMIRGVPCMHCRQ